MWMNPSCISTGGLKKHVSGPSQLIKADQYQYEDYILSLLHMFIRNAILFLLMIWYQCINYILMINVTYLIFGSWWSKVVDVPWMTVHWWRIQHGLCKDKDPKSQHGIVWIEIIRALLGSLNLFNCQLYRRDWSQFLHSSYYHIIIYHRRRNRGVLRLCLYKHCHVLTCLCRLGAHRGIVYLINDVHTPS